MQILENQEVKLKAQQYSGFSVDPKNKTAEKKETVVNGQEDNSYDENKGTKEKETTIKQENTNKDFEYSDNGEFENDSFVSDTNPNDEYL